MTAQTIGRRRVFLNGSVFDGHQHHRGWGVLVSGDRIVAVGPDREIGDCATDVVDLAGGLLLPGFQDAHVHPVQGGLERTACDLSGLTTQADYLRVVSSHAAEHPRLEWLRGGGWAMSAFGREGPRASALDSVVPGLAVFLPSRDHHSAWVSSRALEIAGIDQSTPDPPDGRLERDAQGRPTGTLHEGAMSLVEQHLPQVSEQEQYRGFLVAQEYLHSLGVRASRTWRGQARTWPWVATGRSAPRTRCWGSMWQ